MKKIFSAPKVFFNASVILSGIYSPSGGSGILLIWAKQKKITPIISEIIIDEVIRWAPKIGKTKEEVKRLILKTFPRITPPPDKDSLKKFENAATDVGDIHVLASTRQTNCDYLVTLDKKHLLSIASKIRDFQIVSPKQLITKFNSHPPTKTTWKI